MTSYVWPTTVPSPPSPGTPGDGGEGTGGVFGEKLKPRYFSLDCHRVTCYPIWYFEFPPCRNPVRTITHVRSDFDR